MDDNTQFKKAVREFSAFLARNLTEAQAQEAVTLLGNVNNAVLESYTKLLVAFTALDKKTERFYLASVTFQDLLLAIERKSGSYQSIDVELRTFRRFLEEGDAPEKSTAEVEEEVQRKIEENIRKMGLKNDSPS